ncbi:hypothetical protein GJ744_001310 [Endocarpon pusillum]|uniref:NB-ARC domain-containing protein n=1 Tax=Endocarpon pusillum TaxID=364733 RepID=A0A8H7E3D9_9EURO|nr:hypothetical protein GJ744_001310 [Endocarpon pusillum]
MYELLCGHSSRAAVVLHGLGGIGKTQLAIEYIRRHKEKHTAIFWLNANDEDSLRLSFRSIAQQVLKYYPSTGVLSNIDLEGDLDRMVNAVKTWLDHQDNARWLMVFDNYDNPRTPGSSDRSTVDIRRYLPESDHGSIIITTRSARVTQGQRLHIQKLTSLEDGLKILANMSGRESIENDPDAKALVSKLDGLPLALSMAGAYLEHVTTSFAEYLRLYEASWSKLQRTSPTLNSYEDRSLYTTWQVTFDRIQKQNTASAQLLKLWAYFDKQDVWFELLRHARSTDDEWIKKLIEDELNFNEAVRLLCEYGLAHLEPSLGQSSGSAGYGVHSCVHSWTISVLNGEWDDGLMRIALTCVASEVPNDDVDKWWLLQHKRDDKQYLVAELATGSAAGGDKAGWYVDSICLDDYISNDHGSLRWGKGPTSATPPETSSCSMMGGTLAAQLAARGDTGCDGWRNATIDLGERLANDHGRFKYID